jgi:hypothetical protein
MYNCDRLSAVQQENIFKVCKETDLKKIHFFPFWISVAINVWMAFVCAFFGFKFEFLIHCLKYVTYEQIIVNVL